MGEPGVQARKSGHLPPQYSMEMCCPKCRSRATLVWEKSGADRTLVRLTGQFYERLSSKAPYPIELVCLKCGTSQAE